MMISRDLLVVSWHYWIFWDSETVLTFISGWLRSSYTSPIMCQ